MLVGNKSDRSDRFVTEAEGRSLAEELHMPFLETSARTADNVDAAFLRMAEMLLSARTQVEKEEETTVDPTKPSGSGGSGSTCKCG